jgi:hypothetical protein
MSSARSLCRATLLAVCLLLVGGASANATVAKHSPLPKLRMVDGFVTAGKPLVGATVTITGRNGAPLANLRSGINGYFAVRLAHAPGSYVRVTVTGGRLGGRVFGGTLVAELARFTTGTFVYVNPFSTLVAAYAKAHPSAGLTLAMQRVERFLVIPKATPAFAFALPMKAFDANVFVARAQAGGGIDRYVARLVRKMDNPAARVTFPATAANGIAGSLAGAILGRVLNSVLNKACVAGGGLEDFLSEVGACAAQDQNAAINNQFTQIDSALNGINMQLQALSSELTNLNWNIIFTGEQSTGQQAIKTLIPDAYGDLGGMQAALALLGTTPLDSCPPPNPAGTGSGPCSTYQTDYADFVRVALELEESSDVIFDGLTGNDGEGLLSNTFLGAQQAVIGGSLSQPYSNKPVFTSADVATLTNVQDTMRDTQALQYDIILIYQKGIQLSTQVCPPITEPVLPNVDANACDWANKFAYYAAEEQEWTLSVSPLPSDIAVDTRTGLLWNIYPQQTCDAFFGSTSCGNADVPNPDPDYSIGAFAPLADFQVCRDEQTVPTGFPTTVYLPADGWTALPGSCLNDYMVYDSALSTYIGPYMGPPEFQTPVYLASWAQEMQLIDGWGTTGGTIADYLRRQGFQDVHVPNGNWSWLTDPGLGYNADLQQGYGPGCNAGNGQSTNGQLTTGLLYPSGNCFGQWDFALQSGYAPDSTQFFLSADDITNVPAPTTLPSTQ